MHLPEIKYPVPIYPMGTSNTPSYSPLAGLIVLHFEYTLELSLALSSTQN